MLNRSSPFLSFSLFYLFALALPAISPYSWSVVLLSSYSPPNPFPSSSTLLPSYLVFLMFQANLFLPLSFFSTFEVVDSFSSLSLILPTPSLPPSSSLSSSLFLFFLYGSMVFVLLVLLFNFSIYWFYFMFQQMFVLYSFLPPVCFLFLFYSFINLKLLVPSLDVKWKGVKGNKGWQTTEETEMKDNKQLSIHIPLVFYYPHTTCILLSSYFHY